jgi:heavy metal sensor kinase
MIRSVRFRLTIWYVVILAIILAAFSFGVYWFMRGQLYHNLDDSVEHRANILQALVMFDDDRPTLASSIFEEDPDANESFVRLFDATGGVTFTNPAFEGDIPVDATAVQKSLSGRRGRDTARTETIGGSEMRVRTFPIRQNRELLGVLEVGQPEDDLRETMRALGLILGVAYPVTLVGASLGGLFLASRALSPIDSLTRLARRLSAEDLSQRLNLKLPDDEVGRLARTFDEMLERLEDSFRRQRRFTADASHELRTPLTSIKGQVEVALERDRDSESYREVLRSVNADTDRMIRLVGSLLTLARADAGQVALHREDVDLGGVVRNAVDHVRPEAERAGVSLTLDPGRDVRVKVDPDLILQLMLNLLDNAVKYTGDKNGSVAVSWRESGPFAELSVTDNGPGIPEEHLARIFDRFYRVDKARSRADGGAGLGLSISRWIAEAHGGAIHAESAEGQGTRFTVRLPLS